MIDLSDEIIKSAQEGDRRSFEMIFQAYFNYVANVAYRVVANKQDAEEVVQETFMTIYRNIKGFEFRSTFKTWAYRITVNTALNYVKKNTKHRNNANFDDTFSASQPPEAYTQLEGNETKERLQQLLDALTPEHKTIMVLRSLQGLSYQEIAETLEIPINTVRSRIKRAREALLAIKNEVIKDEV